MSRLLTLQPAFQGMTVIVNVLNKVGPSEQNDTTDVRIVQRLTQMAGRTSQAGVRIGLPAATGRYDAATGFWIYHLQNVQRRSHPNQIVDGIVSPARGTSYAGRDHWAIVILNGLAKGAAGAEYAAFVASGGTT